MYRLLMNWSVPIYWKKTHLRSYNLNTILKKDWYNFTGHLIIHYIIHVFEKVFIQSSAFHWLELCLQNILKTLSKLKVLKTNNHFLQKFARVRWENCFMGLVGNPYCLLSAHPLPDEQMFVQRMLNKHWVKCCGATDQAIYLFYGAPIKQQYFPSQLTFHWSNLINIQ